MEENDSVLQKLHFDAEYESDNDYEKFIELFALYIIQESASQIDEIRRKGFEPTGYLLYKHFGLK